MILNDLTPKALFGYFEEICGIPHPSKHEEKMSAWLRQFGESRGLVTKVDEAGNVVISKPATPGMEDRKTIILQSHMDMVCESNKGVNHDFMTDPIRLVIDGEWLKADGTTLGADNGVGMAAALAVLTDETIKHGPIECVFTVDEETGLTGANAMQGGFMNGDILLNLDSEDEGEIFIGCAGGVRTDAAFKYSEVAAPADYFFFKVTINNLLGGHSGDDINKGHANANKVLNRFLLATAEKYDMYLAYIEGGNKHNAIPREAMAVCAVPKKDKENVRVDFNIFAAEVEAEYAAVESKARFVLESADAQEKVMDKDTMMRLLRAL
ncbi:MAG: beta-Ala-His dipeptidase, partial [Bacteroidaceae bacterium]|nr:beta-Ala-His dipeptidase [Bacteroidaceae bacterium]